MHMDGYYVKIILPRNKSHHYVSIAGSRCSTNIVVNIRTRTYNWRVAYASKKKNNTVGNRLEGCTKLFFSMNLESDWLKKP